MSLYVYEQIKQNKMLKVECTTTCSKTPTACSKTKIIREYVDYISSILSVLCHMKATEKWRLKNTKATHGFEINGNQFTGEIEWATVCPKAQHKLHIIY